MQRKSKTRTIEVYDLDISSTYFPGDAESFREILHVLGNEIIDVLEHNSDLSIDEVDVALEELKQIIFKIDDYRALHLSSSWDSISDALDSSKNEVLEENNNLIDWEKVNDIIQPAYLDGSSSYAFSGNDWVRDLVAGMTNIFQQMRSASGSNRTVRQLHITEFHSIFMRYLGVQYLNPRNQITGFARFVNDVHALRIIQKPSEYFLREPIRGYRNLESSGVMEIVKAESREDPKKLIDFYGFAKPSGEAIALKDLRDIGIKYSGDMQQFALMLAELYPEEVRRLRDSSDYARFKLEQISA